MDGWMMGSLLWLLPACGWRQGVRVGVVGRVVEAPLPCFPFLHVLPGRQAWPHLYELHACVFLCVCVCVCILTDGLHEWLCTLTCRRMPVCACVCVSVTVWLGVLCGRGMGAHCSKNGFAAATNVVMSAGACVGCWCVLFPHTDVTPGTPLRRTGGTPVSLSLSLCVCVCTYITHAWVRC